MPVTTQKKDTEVTQFLADLKQQIGTLEGVKVKWPDGREFIHEDSQWRVLKSRDQLNA